METEYTDEKHEIAGWLLCLFGAAITCLNIRLSWQHVSVLIGGAALAVGYRAIKAGPFEMTKGPDNE